MTKQNSVAVAPDDRFLDAAGRLFRQKGFEATTVREIARAAGVLPGSLHYRYPTKAALLLALMKRGVERELNALRSAISASRDPAERLRLAFRARLAFLLSRDAAKVVLYDWRSLRGRARDEMIRLRDRYEAFWSGLLYEAAGAGWLRPDLDLRLLRLMVLGALNGVALWYSPGGPRSADEIADAFFGLITYGVLDERHRPAGIEEALRAFSVLEPAVVGGA